MLSPHGGIQKVRSSWKGVGGGGGGGGGEGNKSEQNKGVAKLICTLALWKKITWLFKQQIEFFLISCLAVAKSFAVFSLVQHIKAFFLLNKIDIFSFNAF